MSKSLFSWVILKVLVFTSFSCFSAEVLAGPKKEKPDIPLWTENFFEYVKMNAEGSRNFFEFSENFPMRKEKSDSIRQFLRISGSGHSPLPRLSVFKNGIFYRDGRRERKLIYNFEPKSGVTLNYDGLVLTPPKNASIEEKLFFIEKRLKDQGSNARFDWLLNQIVPEANAMTGNILLGGIIFLIFEESILNCFGSSQESDNFECPFRSNAWIINNYFSQPKSDSDDIDRKLLQFKCDSQRVAHVEIRHAWKVRKTSYIENKKLTWSGGKAGRTSVRLNSHTSVLSTDESSFEREDNCEIKLPVKDKKLSEPFESCPERNYKSIFENIPVSLLEECCKDPKGICEKEVQKSIQLRLDRERKTKNTSSSNGASGTK